MEATAEYQPANSGGSFAPLREPAFRRIWVASLFSNFGAMILGVGAAWEMTRLSTSPSMVALVQTASMLPLMLVALPAGAVADMFDRRKIAMLGLGFATVCSIMLTGLAFLDLVTPWVLLLFCVLIGSGVALFNPSWQASIGEQVSRPNLPAAVTLGTISFNVARSFGPAIGGLIVLAAGAQAAFAINSTFYLPLLAAFFLWRREHVPSRLPPERIDRAIVTGGRYALHSPLIRTVVLRSFVFGVCGATGTALAPLVAKDLLAGDAGIYGLLLGALGLGAVLGALFVGKIRDRISNETAVRLGAVATGLSLIAVGLSHSLIVTCIGLFVIGLSNILTMALLNVSVQMSSPRWVTARALSLFTSAITGGVALGSWMWGLVATHQDVTFAFLASGVASIVSALLGIILPLARDRKSDPESIPFANEPEVALQLTLRSGPVVIEVEYDVDPDRARDFHSVIMRLQRARSRIGAFDWSISRDIANPATWIERYHCPTWGDYLRMRDRYTQSELDLLAMADTYHRGEGRPPVRRRLERPFGSVRWKAESPDVDGDSVGYIAP